jgi:pentatricopeptide repeat protein
MFTKNVIINTAKQVSLRLTRIVQKKTMTRRNLSIIQSIQSIHKPILGNNLVTSRGRHPRALLGTQGCGKCFAAVQFSTQYSDLQMGDRLMDVKDITKEEWSNKNTKEGLLKALYELCNDISVADISREELQEIAESLMPLLGEDDRDIFDTIIQAYCDAGGHLSAYKILHKMRKAGCKPEHSTYSKLIFTFSRLGHHNKVEKAVRQMLKDGIQPNERIYNSLIHVWGKKHSSRTPQWKKIEELMQSMKDQHIQPTRVTYNILFQIYDKAGNWEMLLKNIHRMKEQGTQPNNVTYNILFEACNRAEEWDMIDTLVNEMKMQKLRLNIEIATTLIKAYGNSKSLERVEYLYHEIMLYDIRTDDEFYNAYITALINAGGKMERIEEVFNSCRERKIPTNAVIYNAFIRAVSTELLQSQDTTTDKARLLQNLEDVYEEMKESEYIKPNAVSYTLLIREYDRLNNFQMVDKIFKEMKQAKTELTRKGHYATVIQAYNNAGNEDQVKRLRIEAQKKNISTNGMYNFDSEIYDSQNLSNKKRELEYYNKKHLKRVRQKGAAIQTRRRKE